MSEKSSAKKQVSNDIGLKCGIEIHQQLEGKKLFCSCPTLIREESGDFTVSRKLRASAGESGKVDVAAKQEQLRNKQFIYEGYNDSTCLVELDEEPPHEINQEALHTCLQFSKAVGADVSPVVQVMRKTVVDGSNTSGFQRTALIGRNGHIKTSEGKVRIANISIEEDSCKIVSESESEKRYRLDRLGIPLIEVGTEPDIKSATQCQEAARKLGMFLRSLPGIKRGLGTIRQDVNVSVKGGTRIEVKGAQDLRQIPLLVELEAKRQLELLKVRDELKKVKVAVESEMEVVDVTQIMKKSSEKFIVSRLENGSALAICVSGFTGFIGRELQPNYRVGSELAGRAKRRAGVKGIIHSDEFDHSKPAKYGLSAEMVLEIKKKLSVKSKDAFIIVIGKEEIAKIALDAVWERIGELFLGVPKEVRKANTDGTTTYLRPMPGAARMYPETDVPLFEASVDNVELPELLEDKVARFQKEYGLSADLAAFMAKSDNVGLFEELAKKYPKMKAAFIADTLGATLLEIKRKYSLETSGLQRDNFRELFKFLDEGKIHKDIVIDVLIDMIKGQFEISKYEGLSTEELHKVIVDIVSKNKSAPMGALMGMCMKALSGKASGKVISENLQKILREGHK